MQYSIDKEPQLSSLTIVSAVGCLAQTSQATWVLDQGSAPTASNNQGTSDQELKAAAGEPLGDKHYQLLGVSAFRPSNYTQQKVAVKGVLIPEAKGGNRLNVTSLQRVAGGCS
jgi:hypothetical protein